VQKSGTPAVSIMCGPTSLFASCFSPSRSKNLTHGVRVRGTVRVRAKVRVRVRVRVRIRVRVWP